MPAMDAIINWFMNAIKRLRFGGGPFRCIVCGNSVRIFFCFSDSISSKAKANGFPYDFRRMETLNYEQCNCPFCLSSDRERLYLIFLESYLKDTPGKKFRILDFAPSPYFSIYLRSKENVNYVSADYLRPEFDIKLDVSNMSEISDDSVDILICSHVLEHVDDVGKALREIQRVIKKDGIAIIMVPLFWDVKETLENLTALTDEDRLKYFGQEDHMRLFSRQDFLQRITASGMHVQCLSYNDFDLEEAIKNAIAQNSRLYVCRPNLSSPMPRN